MASAANALSAMISTRIRNPSPRVCRERGRGRPAWRSASSAVPPHGARGLLRARGRALLQVTLQADEQVVERLALDVGEAMERLGAATVTLGPRLVLEDGQPR